MQETHTEFGVDLPAMARGAGFTETATVWTAAELEAAIPLLYAARGPVFVDVKVTAKAYKLSLPMRDGPSIKHRFRENLLGKA
jgi:thiamine pyrophosphate-dependent acetolactate synthase large subunit-like protein